MNGQIVAQSLRDILRIKHVPHPDGDADAFDCGVRPGDGLSHLRDDGSQSNFNLWHEDMDGLDEVLVIPGRDTFHDEGKVVEKFRPTCPSREMERRDLMNFNGAIEGMKQPEV